MPSKELKTFFYMQIIAYLVKILVLLSLAVENLLLKETVEMAATSDIQITEKDQTKYFKNERNEQLAYFVNIPFTPMKAAVVFLHGIGDHSGRYTHFFEFLGKQGIATFAFDQHGHGKSEGERVCCNRFHNFVDDVNQFTTLVRSTYLKEQLEARKDFPLFISGISFGGLITSHVVLSKVHDWTGMIICCGAVGIELTPMLRLQNAFAPLLNALLPKAHLVEAVRTEDMSRDPQVIKEFLEDPLLVTGNLRVNIGVCGVKGMAELEERMAEISIPVLAVHGSGDKCTSAKAAENLVEHVSSTDKEFKLFPGVYHLLFHEPEKQQIMDYIFEWINKRS